MKNKDMGKNNEIKTVVPVLRFPEFIKTKGWEIILIGNIGETYGGLTGKNKTDFGYGEKYVTYKQVYNNSSVNIAHCDFVCINSSEKQNLVKFGDILFTQSSETPEEVGISSVMLNETNEAIYLNSFCFGLRPFDLKKISPCFSKYLFRSQIFRDKIIPLAQGITRFNISPTKFKTIKIPIPTSTYNDEENTEQQKIADCLSSLDDLIEATAQKVEALKDHKKGLMQRLFPAEGKDVPDLRFSEFQGMKGWEKKQVKDFGEIITGNTPSKKEEKYWNGDFVWVTAQDFKGKYINDSILKLTKFGKDKARVIPKDSVLVTCIASIGLNAINKVECSTNQQINAICCNQEYNYEYVYYLVTYNTKNLKQLAGQTAVPIITKKSFEEFDVYAIKNYDEQQRIADCLSSLDELIEATSRKVEILKDHKKGLMQKLFPKI